MGPFKREGGRVICTLKGQNRKKDRQKKYLFHIRENIIRILNITKHISILKLSDRAEIRFRTNTIDQTVFCLQKDLAASEDNYVF